MSHPQAGIDTQASQNVPSTWRVANVPTLFVSSGLILARNASHVLRAWSGYEVDGTITYLSRRMRGGEGGEGVEWKEGGVITRILDHASRAGIPSP
jgi:hypothetical protein